VTPRGGEAASEIYFKMKGTCMKYSTVILGYYKDRESGKDMKYSAEGRTN